MVIQTNKKNFPTKNKKEILINDNIKFLNVQGQVLHVKIGNDEHQVTDKQRNAIQNYIQEKFREKGINSVVLVTHHLCDIKILETNLSFKQENNERLAN